MSQFSEPANQYPFLAGGGEMGELTQTYDWSTTSLGAPSQWPQSLRTLVAMMLRSRFPMLIFWGPELTTFYNDAFRPSLGDNGKHPSSLGQPGEQSWAESWPVIGPMIYNIMAGGEAVWFEDQKLPLYRGGTIGYAYWTYSFSPVTDDNGSVNGVLVTCSETTNAVESLAQLNHTNTELQQLLQQNSRLRQEEQATQRQLEENQRELLDLFEESPVGIATISADENLTFRYANSFYGELVGRKPEAIVDKPLLEALPELAGQGFDDLLRTVTATGAPFIAKEVAVNFVRHNQLETIYVDLTYQPRRGANGTISGILVVATDVTQQVLSRRQVEESETKLLGVIAAAPAGIGLFIGRDLVIEHPNQTFIDIVGKGPGVDGLPLREALPELLTEGQPFLNILDDVFMTGVPFVSPASLVKIIQNGVLNDNYYNISYTPLRDAGGQIYGILDIAVDVTEQVKAQRALAESEARFRSLIEEAPVATMLMTGPDHVIELANQQMIDMLGKGSSILGKSAVDSVPELATQTYLDLLDSVFTSGEIHKASALPGQLVNEDVATNHYFDFTYKPLRDGTDTIYGIMAMAVDVTHQVLARQKLIESEAHLQLLRDTVPAMIFYLDAEQRYQSYNETFRHWFGVNETEVLGKTVREFVGEAAYQGVLPHLTIAYGGQQEHYELFAPSRMGTDRWLSITYSPHKISTGEVIGLIVHAADITKLKQTQAVLQDREVALQNTIELAKLGTWSMDVATGETKLSQRHADMFGLDTMYMPYETALAIVHPDDRERVKMAFLQAQQPGSTGRYEAEYRIINSRTGKHQIINAQGEVYFNVQGMPLRIAGTAQDVTLEREMRLALENEVQQRTEELAATNEELAATNEELATNNEEYAAINEELEEANSLLMRSNDNLQKFAYVASHDLQEPLRKIQQFGDLLKNQYGPDLGDGVDFLERMQSAASRMSTLIRDLLAFSRISTQRDENKSVDLNRVVTATLATLELAIEEADTQIDIETLPAITGDALQLGQLFQNLLSNALKFRRTGTTPVISVRATLVAAGELPPSAKPTRAARQYYRIDVMDNGIGFEEKYLDRIFQVFQRLHGRNEFAGTGIGLAICEKVVTNHGGAIMASSQPGQGATFSVYLPT